MRRHRVTAEVTRGANERTSAKWPHFPLNPAGDGPYTGRQSIQQLVRGRHQCLVAEVVFDPDPTPVGATPASSDNLSQRNLAVVKSDNPGGPASHRVQHTFEVRPSSPGPDPVVVHLEPPRIRAAVALMGRTAVDAIHELAEGGPVDDHDHDGHAGDLPEGHVQDELGHSFTHLSCSANHEDYGPDELLFQWNDLPRDTKVEVYLPDVDVDEMIDVIAARLGPSVVEKVDDHTVSCTVGDVTYLPLPGGRSVHIPGLVTLELPPTVKNGQRFTVSVHQFSGVTKAIIGAFQLTIPVSVPHLMLGDEVRTLAVLRHIAQGIPTGDRWFSIFARYIGQIEDKVRDLGGDPDAVKPSPDGGPDDQPDDGHSQCRRLVDCVNRALRGCKNVHRWGLIALVVWAWCLCRRGRRRSCRPLGCRD